MSDYWNGLIHYKNMNFKFDDLNFKYDEVTDGFHACHHIGGDYEISVVKNLMSGGGKKRNFFEVALLKGDDILHDTVEGWMRPEDIEAKVQQWYREKKLERNK